MRIVVDGQPLQSLSRLRGIGRYTRSLLRALVSAGAGDEHLLALSGLFPDRIDPVRREFRGLLPEDAIRVWQSPGPVEARGAGNTWRRRAAEQVREAFLASLEPDVILVVSLLEGLADDAATSLSPRDHRPPTAVVCHDLIPHVFRSTYLADPVHAAWYDEKLSQLRRADLWLANSEATRADLIDRLDLPAERIVTISAAADDLFAPRRIDPGRRSDIERRHGLCRPFVLFTAADDPRKNVPSLVRAYAALPEALRTAHQLVVVSEIGPEARQQVAAATAAAGLAPDEVVLTGHVSDDDLCDLYNLCKAFVFPSLYEGFGLPVLEAMQCGAAVICSDRSSLPEIVGAEDALFDPTSIDAMGEKMAAILSDDRFRAELQRRGPEASRRYSWAETARRASRALAELVREGGDGRGRSFQGPGERKPRLAYVSPLPPQQTGISTYSAELLPALAEHYEIDAIVDATVEPTGAVGGNWQVRDVEWFMTNPVRYDRVVYQFGNSEFHRHMFGMLDAIPGIVVLHDFFLSNAVAYMDWMGFRPGDVARALYREQGYPGLVALAAGDSLEEVVEAHPCNLEVLECALQVVVHSEHSRDLAARHYGAGRVDRWAILPLLRAEPAPADRREARRALGIGETEFLVCSFGLSTPHKLVDRTLEAWLASSLGADPQCRMVFVGRCVPKEFERQMQARWRRAGADDRCRITGWVDEADYARYLAAADVAVQLRTSSRGETSAAILDCLSHGLPTVVNAHGSARELPDDTVWKLDDTFVTADLSAALAKLRADPDLRRRLGASARAFVDAHHRPAHCARLYRDAIEEAYRSPRARAALLPRTLAGLRPGQSSPLEYGRLAIDLARTFPPTYGRRQILVDITALTQSDLRTGIQRAVRSILKQILAQPPDGYRIEPVFRDGDHEYRYARAYTCRFLGIPAAPLGDDLVDHAPGDILLLLDLDYATVFAQPAIATLRRFGVRAWAVVYDLLPVLLPHCFPEDSERNHRAWLHMIAGFEGALCISRAVSRELAAWLDAEGPAEDGARPALRWFHLGADIEASVPTRGMPADAGDVLASLASRPTFLTVGTVEPRKGHAQVLDAFEALWRRGVDVGLLVVGKQGWMVRSLVNRLRGHEAMGDRLHWVRDASDEYLEAIYGRSACLIAASEGEGFGLPLIEASRHGVPIVARDLPVFREVAGDHAFYFAGDGGDALAAALETWLDLHERGQAPSSEGMARLTWAESARALCDAITSADAAAPLEPRGDLFGRARAQPGRAAE